MRSSPNDRDDLPNRIALLIVQHANKWQSWKFIVELDKMLTAKHLSQFDSLQYTIENASRNFISSLSFEYQYTYFFQLPPLNSISRDKQQHATTNKPNKKMNGAAANARGCDQFESEKAKILWLDSLK